MLTQNHRSADERAVRGLANSYFDALYEGDAGGFARIFHPAAMLYCFTEEPPIILTTDQYLEIVAGRISPAARNDPRFDEVVSVNIASATTAHLRVCTAYLPKRFTDELSLVKTDDRWRIISKLWHYTLSRHTSGTDLGL
jgi:hypothetical protein